MKTRPNNTAQKKAATIVAIGAVALTGAAIWGRTPIASATDAVRSYTRIATILNRAKAELNLTEKQSARLQSILQEAIPQGIAIHDSKTLTPSQKRTKLQQLRVATRRRVEAVLTPEQRRKAQQFFATARPRIQARLQQVADELELTDAQKTEIRPILAAAFKDGMAIKNDMSLTLAQKFAKAQQLRAETREQLGNILTAEQMEKLDRIVAAAQTDVAAIVRAQRKQNID